MSSIQDQVVSIITSICHPNKPDLSDTSKPLLECGLDSLDFASERLGLGGRLAIDATTKIGPEKRHDWGEPLSRPAELEARVDGRWAELGLADLGQEEPDPALFGYTLEALLARLAATVRG